ncbi:LAFA_0E18712g1_1 [Lachancea sp. 'fantastica']|nr:LAFA_0E18712g1_1 [Lachancea sp. 'fantastica']
MAFDGFTAFEDLSIEAIDNDWWFDLSDQREAKSKSDERRWFKEKLTIPCQVPICCRIVRAVRDIHKFSDFSKVQDSRAKSFAPLDSLQDELGKALTNGPAQNDPETLDDSDLELLAGEDYFTQEEPDEKVIEPSSAPIVSATFIASRNALKTTFKDKVFQCPFDIIDCKIRYSSLNSPEDTAIILSSEGIIYSVAFDAELNPIVLQWWKLNKIDGVPREICMLSPSSQFVVTTDTTLKFFKFTNAYHFELVSNVNITNTTISATAFLNSGERENHFMLFTALSRCKEIILCLTQWGSSDEKCKEVHTLTLLDSEPVSSIIPLDDSRCLAVTEKDIKLVNANQILSGEPTFMSFKRSMFGSSVTKCFDDPILLSKIKSVKEGYQNAAHCTVIATSNGALCCCLSEEEGSISFMALTRVKGLDNAFLLDNSSTTAEFYTVMISAYGQLTETCLDLRNTDELDKDYKISSSQNIEGKRILSAGHAPAESIVYIPGSRTQLEKQDLPCLLSQASLTLLSPNRAVQNCSTLLSVRSFKAVSTLNVINCLDLPEKWQQQLLGDTTADAPQFLILNETRTGKSSLLLIEWAADYSTHKLTELDDLMRDESNDTVAIHFTDRNFVQVTTRGLSVDSLGGNDWFSYQSSFVVSGALCDGKKIIMWNSDCGNVLYIEDVDDTRSEYYEEFKVPLEDEHSKITAVMFTREMNGQESILVVSGATVHQAFLNDLNTPQGGLRRVSEVQVHYGSAFQKEFVLSDLNGGIYRGVIGETMPNKLSLDKLSVNLEFGFPWEVRFVSADECILFSPRTIYSLSLTDSSFAEILVGSHKKHATIIDVKVSGALLFILFSDRLEVVFRSSLTHTRLHQPVKNARIKQKRFLYINRINRMLIVNWSRRTLESVKLENGRIMLLDSRCLESFSTISETVELKANTGPINILIAGSTDTGSCLLKLVQVVPLPGKLITREVSSFHFDGPIPGNVHIVTVSEDSFWVFYGEHFQMFSLDRNMLCPIGLVERSEEKLVSMDAKADIVVALNCSGNFKVKSRQVDGSWITTDVLRRSSSNLKYHKVLVMSRGFVVIIGERHDDSAACAVLTFFAPCGDDVVYFNDIWFADPIKDVKYSPQNDELCVLFENGNLTLLAGQREYHRVSHVVGQRTRIDQGLDVQGQTGCWDITSHKLIPSQS